MIECVNRQHRIVLDDKGNRGVILGFYDADGEDCEPELAVTCVAECAGSFYALNLQDYENVFSN